MTTNKKYFGRIKNKHSNNFSDKKQYYQNKIFSTDKAVVLHAMLEMVEYVDDPNWIAEKLTELIGNSDTEISGLAITCFGHLARIHGTVGNFKKIYNLLDRKKNIQELAGRVQDAFDDFYIFLPAKRRAMRRFDRAKEKKDTQLLETAQD